MLEWADRVLDAVGSDGKIGSDFVGFSPSGGALAVRVQGLICLGRLEDAWSECAKAERVIEELQEFEVLTWLMMFQAEVAYRRGFNEFRLDKGRRALEIAEKLDNESSRMCAYAALANAHLMAGDPAAACDAANENIAIGREFGVQRAVFPRVFALRAEAELALGKRDEALATASEGVELGVSGGCRYFEGEAQIALARALLTTDGIVPRAKVDAALDRADELAESIAGHGLSPQILELRGRLAAALGEPESARVLLQNALDGFTSIGALPHSVSACHCNTAC